MRQPATYLPHSDLRDHISNYAILDIPHGERHTYFSPPIGLSGFIIQSKSEHQTLVAKINGEDYFTSSAVATGQVTQPIYGELIGKVRSILVFFKPLGMHYFFGTNMESLNNKTVPLHDFLGSEVSSRLISNLEGSNEKEDQINTLDNFFLGLNPKIEGTDQLQKVINLIHEREGDVTVKEIETLCHYPRKTLERHFKKQVGLTPKVYANIYQFKKLINLIESEPNLTWSDLANKAGYYDQSHMSRYIKEYLKVPPNSLVKLDMEFINYLLNR